MNTEEGVRSRVDVVSKVIIRIADKRMAGGVKTGEGGEIRRKVGCV